METDELSEPRMTMVQFEDEERRAREMDRLGCEHQNHEDHMICQSCGQCREDLDSADTCMECGGVDESQFDSYMLEKGE